MLRSLVNPRKCSRVDVDKPGSIERAQIASPVVVSATLLFTGRLARSGEMHRCTLAGSYSEGATLSQFIILAHKGEKLV